MDPGPYNPDWLHGKDKNLDRMTEYDMSFAKQLLPDMEIERLFSDATNEKRWNREEGNETRTQKVQDGSELEVEGS